MADSKLPPVGSPERDYVVQRILSDTGFYCRYVLGMDSDRDENGNITSEEGKGGVRDHGPHQEVVSFLDDEDENNRFRILMAPRYSYKSSILRGFIQRKIIAHPNISILLYMHEQDAATKRCLEIRDDLENNPILRELFPNMRSSRMWQRGQFITGLRTDKAGDSPTLFVASPQKSVTGSRPNLVLFDDIVQELKLTDGALAKGRQTVERSLLLGARGCTYIDVGTPYHYADAHHWVMAQRGWKRLTHLDVGYDMVVNDDKTMDLKGQGRWPNLSLSFLREKLRGGVSFPTFMSQYKLQVVAGTHQAFQRHQFQVASWSERFQDLTGYLLTDVAQGTPPGATSTETRKALNVLLYVGVDERNRVYILDCNVGRWPMIEFCERYMAMLDKWSGRVNHRAELWEQVHSNTGYASYLTYNAKQRGRRVAICWQSRSGTEANKINRINCTQVRFQAKEVFFCADTMPRQWVDDAEVRPLFEPEGYVDPRTNLKMPGGDLVEQFIRFPHHALMDIPDAFSLIDSMDKETGQRVCFWMKPSRQRIAESEQRRTTVVTKTGASDRFYARLRGNRGARTGRTG